MRRAPQGAGCRFKQMHGCSVIQHDLSNRDRRQPDSASLPPRPLYPQVHSLNPPHTLVTALSVQLTLSSAPAAQPLPAPSPFHPQAYSLNPLFTHLGDCLVHVLNKGQVKASALCRLLASLCVGEADRVGL